MKVLFIFLAFVCLTSCSFSVDAFVTPVRIHATLSTLLAGPTTLEPPTKESTRETTKQETPQDEKKSKKGGWAVRLFNDVFNKREFVALCLTKIVGLTDAQSYQVMMQAHQNGLAVVGRFDLEKAEWYRNALKDQGLVCDMIPVEDE